MTLSFQLSLYILLFSTALAAMTKGWLNTHQCLSLITYPMLPAMAAILATSYPQTTSQSIFYGYVALAATALPLVVYLLNVRLPLYGDTKEPSTVAVIPRSAKPEVVTLIRDPDLPPPTSVVPTPDDLYIGRRLIVLDGKIDNFSAKIFSQECARAVYDGANRILVQISTQGGESNWGWKVYEQLRLLHGMEGVEVNVLVMGPCYSAGVPIIMGVPLENRFATKHSRFMVHASSFVYQDGQQVPLSALDSTSLGELDHIDDNFVLGLLCENTAIQRDGLEKLLAERKDCYLTAQEAWSLGIISGTV
jgi:ATP-dependent protease ClpP protease subunit